MKVYHYTPKAKLSQILDTGKLIPQPNIGLPEGQLPQGIVRTGVFALTEPLPNAWISDEVPFSHMLNVLTFYRGRDLILTEIETDGLNAQVFDFAHNSVYRGMHKYGPDTIPQKYRIPDSILEDWDDSLEFDEASRRFEHGIDEYQHRGYLNSAIPLDEYVKRQTELDYRVPEVVLMSDQPIPTEGRFKVSMHQPLLEEYLAEMKDEARRAVELQELLQAAQGGLDGWYQSYLDQQRDIGIPPVRGERSL